MAEPDPPHEEGCAEPVFWFELGPEGYSYGMGFWQAPAVTMASSAPAWTGSPRPWKSWPAASRSRTYLCWRGGTTSAPRPPLPAAHPWYSKKELRPLPRRPPREPLWSHDLVDLLLEGYEFLLPYYEYMLSSAVTPIPGHNNRIYIVSNPPAAHAKAKGFLERRRAGWSELPGGGGRGHLSPRCCCFALAWWMLPAAPGPAAEADAVLETGEGEPCPTVPAGQKLIALTFDDGPRRSTTTRLLDGLSERRVKAPFLPHRAQIENNGDVVRRMDEEGTRSASTPSTTSSSPL